MKERIKLVLNTSERVPILSYNYSTSSVEMDNVWVTTTSIRSGHYDFQNKYTPAAGDKIFIYPDSGVPRFKMKEYCLKNKISLIRDPSKATAKFINLRNLVDNIKHAYYYVIKRDRIVLFINQNPGTFSPQIEGFIRASKYCLLDYSTLNMISSSDKINPVPKAASAEKFTHDQYADLIRNVITYYDDTMYKSMSDFIISTDVFSHEDLIEELSSGMVMDKELYLGLRRLFDSNDTSNHVIAMESMANCDFQKSAVYLLCLMRDYRSEIYNSNVRNHVNFKALRNYFNWDMTVLTTDGIVSKLKERNLNTKENVNLFLPEVMVEITETNKLTNFKVKSVEYTGEYDDDVFEDLVPVDSNPQDDGEDNSGTGV